MTGPIEVIAAAFGIIGVWFGTRQSILSWPFGLVNVSLYTLVFFNGRLYGQMGLQGVYFALSVYGWYQWLHGGQSRGRLTVSRATPRTWSILMALNLVAFLALAWLLRQTDAALPWLDALLTTTSLVAQWMMTRKVLETWLLWIAVDLVYVPMFLTQEFYATAALYAVFLGLAVLGLRDWQRSMGTRQAAGA